MKNFLNHLSKFITSFLGLGFIPFIPGTFGSAAGAVIYYFLWQRELIFYAVLFCLVSAGFSVCGRAEIAFGKKDSRRIVIDEVSGAMISFILVPRSIFNITVVFALFRIFDVVKPYPIRRLERLPGSFGIMLDDIVAGIYANLTFQIVLFCAGLYRLILLA